MLTPTDRLLFSSGRHDMDLCEEGAKMARGEVLFFTESHCWPEPDVLEKAAEALRSHPEWAGFSCHSQRVTHNRLSTVEADLYEADIEYGMTQHPWRKILDQCFVVRREPYFAAGGFDASYGHFAEWLLAARFYQRGFAVGFLPEARMHHYYVGDIEVWKTFTEDFTRGEMRFHGEGASDPCAHLFEPVTEWVMRGNWDRVTARGLLQMLWQDWLGAKQRGADWKKEHEEVTNLFWRWLPVAVAGTALAKWRLGWRSVVERWRISKLMRRAPLKQLRQAALRYSEAITKLERLRYVDEQQTGMGILSADHLEGVDHGTWEFGQHYFRSVGMHPPESWKGEVCCWAEPTALLQLPVSPGYYEVRMQWFPMGGMVTRRKTRFYFNGRPLPLSDEDEHRCSARFHVTVGKDGQAKLGWVCRRFSAPKDPRALGLLVRRLSWRRMSAAQQGASETALFLLHIRKTAGVSLRNLIENRFPDGACLFQAHAKTNAAVDPNFYSFVTGHVNFGYLGRIKKRPVTMTVLREPIDRAVSAFYFFRGNSPEQLATLREELSAEEFAQRAWLTQMAGRLSFRELIEREPELAKAHLGNHMTRMLLTTTPEGELNENHLAEARRNLASFDVIGLTERLGDTLLLLKHAMGWSDLGPIAHENRTQNRRAVSDEDPAVLELLKEWNRLDSELYAFACQLFEERFAKLNGDQVPGNDSILPEPSKSPLPDAVQFTFDQAIHGYGWHLRERTGDGCICWMGAEMSAWVDLQLSKPVQSTLSCHIAYVLSPQILESVQVCVNGHTVSMQLTSEGQEHVLRGDVPAEWLCPNNGRVRVMFTVGHTIRPCDVNPNHPDRRPLGIALSRLALTPAANAT